MQAITLPPAMDIQITELIARFPLFQGMAPAHLARIGAELKTLRLARGEVLFQRGDHPPGFYIVLEGQLKLGLTSPQGIEKVIDIVTPGKSFGEAITFLERPAPVSAQATQNSRVVLIPRPTLFGLLQEDPAVARHMLASLSARMHQLVGSIEAISLLSGTQRLIGYLLQLSSQSPDPARITLHATKATIAALLNITPETLSRIMHRLSEAGLIAVYGKEIDILDLDGLRDYQCNL